MSIPPGASLTESTVEVFSHSSSAQWFTMAWWMWKRMRAWWLCSLIILTTYILCESSKCTPKFDCIDGICNSGFFCLCNENWWDDLCQLCRERSAFLCCKLNLSYVSSVEKKERITGRSYLLLVLCGCLSMEYVLWRTTIQWWNIVYCQCLQILVLIVPRNAEKFLGFEIC